MLASGINKKIQRGKKKMDFVVKDALKNSEPKADEYKDLARQANIKVIGVGGAGNNMVSWLYKKGIKGAEIIACNTDQQHLDISSADHSFLIGKEVIIDEKILYFAICRIVPPAICKCRYNIQQ